MSFSERSERAPTKVEKPVRRVVITGIAGRLGRLVAEFGNFFPQLGQRRAAFDLFRLDPQDAADPLDTFFLDALFDPPLDSLLNPLFDALFVEGAAKNDHARLAGRLGREAFAVRRQLEHDHALAVRPLAEDHGLLLQLFVF